MIKKGMSFRKVRNAHKTENTEDYLELIAELLNSKSGSVYFLKKAGILLEQNEEFIKAIEIYETALDKYLKGADRSYDREKTEMEKYLARAKASK